METGPPIEHKGGHTHSLPKYTVKFETEADSPEGLEKNIQRGMKRHFRRKARRQVRRLGR